MGPEVKFYMLPFVMFDYTPGLGHENILNPINGIEHSVLKLESIQFQIRIKII